jgi:hypothetical protein
MTVGELIQHLQRFSEDREITVTDGKGDITLFRGEFKITEVYDDYVEKLMVDIDITGLEYP